MKCKKQKGFTIIELFTAKQQGGRNKGFTIIELLIVMTVIAILAGISIFSMDDERKSARDGTRQSYL